MKNIDKDRLQMYVSIVRITIVLCWLSLFSFWIVKLIGYDIFRIAVNNDNFLRFSDLVQNSWLKYLVSFITISIVYYFMFGAVLQKFLLKGKDFILFLSSVISVWVVVNFVNIAILEMFLGYAIITVVGIVKQNRWKKLLGALTVALDFFFVTISMITRSIELQVTTNYFVLLILSIDVDLMFCLYYLYSNLIKLKKEK